MAAARGQLTLRIALSAGICALLLGCSGVDSPVSSGSPGDAGAGSEMEPPVDSPQSGVEDGSGENHQGDQATLAGGAGDIGTVMDEIDALLRHWHNGDAQEVAQCMHTAGFPQLLELVSSMGSSSGQSTGKLRQLTTIYAHELGPLTESQARQFGILGSHLIGASERPRPGNVISNDPSYSAARHECIEASRVHFEAEDVTEMKAIAQSNHDLKNAVISQFRTAVGVQLEELLLERLACVRDGGYPDLDLDAIQGSGGSPEDDLRMVGIEPGETRRIVSDRHEELEAPLEPGETRLVLGSDMSREHYIPSPAEIEFALVFVDCSERIRFVERLEQIQVPVRAAIVAEHEMTILGLREKIDAVLQR